MNSYKKKLLIKAIILLKKIKLNFKKNKLIFKNKKEFCLFKLRIAIKIPLKKLLIRT